jgi:hypothetical protein
MITGLVHKRLNLFWNPKYMSIVQSPRRRRNVWLLASILVALILIISSVFVAKSLAGPGLPFGGMTTFVQRCTCSCGAVVVVGPPRGGPLLYCPGISRVFEFFQIPRTGVWLLGNYAPGGICLIRRRSSCIPAPIQPIGTILIVGTSR